MIKRKGVSGLLSLMLAIMLAIAGCGGGGSSSNDNTGTPAAPTGVSATPGSGSITISWSVASGATSYNIYWSTTTGVSRANGTKIADATSPYSHTSLTNGTTYYYVVTAVNANGESTESSQVSAVLSALSGVVSKGLINGATVTVYALDAAGTKGEVLATGTTDANGAYSLNIGSYAGSVIIEATGGTYTDEATNSPKTNGDTFRAALTGITDSAQAAVTPLTEIAVRKAGTLTTANITAANTVVSNMIGGTDIISTMPANVLVSSASTTDEKNYGLMLAAISQMVLSGTATSVSGALGAITDDLADNTLDTTGANISAALTSFISSPNNQSGMTASTTPAVEGIASSTTTEIDDGVTPSGMTNASLNGTYNFTRQVNGFPSGTETMVLAGRGSITFDGNGGCTASLIDTEYDLAITTQNVATYAGTTPISCTYSVTGDGSLTLTFTGDSISSHGSVNAAGNAFTIGGPDSELYKVMVMVGMKTQ